MWSGPHRSVPGAIHVIAQFNTEGMRRFNRRPNATRPPCSGTQGADEHS